MSELIRSVLMDQWNLPEGEVVEKVANIEEMIHEAIDNDDFELAEDIIQAELGLGPEHLSALIL